MTAQISDTFRYRGQAHALAGINGSGLFDPVQHGIRPAAVSTACWRGYHCRYEVADGMLLLTEVYLGLGEEDLATAERGEGPKLFGKVPKRCTVGGIRSEPGAGAVEIDRDSPEFGVDGLREIVAFTGGLLLGDDFVEEMYVHMGFHPAYKFRIVHELIFAGGRLTAEHDRSAQMAEFREMLSSRPLEPGADASRTELAEWIKQCFSLEYGGLGA
jgi:hypothetical protein